MEETTTVGLTIEDLIQLATPFAQLMNQMQADGTGIQSVVCGGLYALGCAIAQMGTHIDVGGPLNEMAPPLALGYTRAMDTEKRTRMM